MDSKGLDDEYMYVHCPMLTTFCRFEVFQDKKGKIDIVYAGTMSRRIQKKLLTLVSSVKKQ